MQLIKSTNEKMHRFVGIECDIFLVHRNDGRKVLLVTEHGNKDNWYFYTSTVRKIDKHAENGIETIRAITSNSEYVFKSYKW